MFEQRESVALGYVLGRRPDDTPAETDGGVVFVHVGLKALRPDVSTPASRPALDLERDHAIRPGEVEAPLTADRRRESELAHGRGQLGGADMQGQL